MARNAGHFPHLLTIDLRDQTGWLGREDSNLRMAESKSDTSASDFNTRSENPTESRTNQINEIFGASECSARGN
jgi:hypothetical protein